MYCSCSVGLRSLTGDAYHEFVTPHSRFGAIRAAASPARGAKQAAAIPASCNRLYRIAKHLRDKEQFYHSNIHRSQTIDGTAFPLENAAPIASAMQFFRGLRDHASLIARAGKFVLAGLAAAVAAGDRGGAIGRAAGDFVQLHLAGKAVIEADDRHAEMQEVGDDGKQRSLLAAMPSGARGEGAADFAVQ